jgi:hypothetical protein
VVTRVAAREVEEGQEMVVPVGFVSDGALSIRLFAPTQMSEVWIVQSFRPCGSFISSPLWTP